MSLCPPGGSAAPLSFSLKGYFGAKKHPYDIVHVEVKHCGLSCISGCVDWLL